MHESNKERKDYKLRLVYLNYKELMARGYSSERALDLISEYTHAVVLARLYALIELLQASNKQP